MDNTNNRTLPSIHHKEQPATKKTTVRGATILNELQQTLVRLNEKGGGGMLEGLVFGIRRNLSPESTEYLERHIMKNKDANIGNGSFSKAEDIISMLLSYNSVSAQTQMKKKSGKNYDLENDGSAPPSSLRKNKVAYSLYHKYLEEISFFQEQCMVMEDEVERADLLLFQANLRRETLSRQLRELEDTLSSGMKQVDSERESLRYMEDQFSRQLEESKKGNEQLMRDKLKSEAQLADANNEMATLKKLNEMIETKLQEVAEDTVKIKKGKEQYELSSTVEKDSMKNQVAKLQERSEELNKGLERVNNEIDNRVKTQKILEDRLAKTKEELRSLFKQFTKKQQKEEERQAKQNEKSSLFDEVVASGAPSGEVTLVFSNVEGSKEQWELHPMAMTIAADIHNNVVRDKIKENSGYEVKSDGDSFMVAFHTVQTAVNYCLGVQEALLGADWPIELLSSSFSAEEISSDGRLLFRGLRCRMGVHVGKPQCRPNPINGRMDYFGSMVNKAARVSGLACGGRVLVSEAVWKKLNEGTDNEGRLSLKKLSIRQLGAYTLRGIPGEEHIVEILPRTLKDRKFPPIIQDNSPNSITPSSTNSSSPQPLSSGGRGSSSRLLSDKEDSSIGSSDGSGMSSPRLSSSSITPPIKTISSPTNKSEDEITELFYKIDETLTVNEGENADSRSSLIVPPRMKTVARPVPIGTKPGSGSNPSSRNSFVYESETEALARLRAHYDKKIKNFSETLVMVQEELVKVQTERDALKESHTTIKDKEQTLLHHLEKEKNERTDILKKIAQSSYDKQITLGILDKMYYRMWSLLQDQPKLEQNMQVTFEERTKAYESLLQVENSLDSNVWELSEVVSNQQKLSKVADELQKLVEENLPLPYPEEIDSGGDFKNSDSDDQLSERSGTLDGRSLDPALVSSIVEYLQRHIQTTEDDLSDLNSQKMKYAAKLDALRVDFNTLDQQGEASSASSAGVRALTETSKQIELQLAKARAEREAHAKQVREFRHMLEQEQNRRRKAIHHASMITRGEMEKNSALKQRFLSIVSLKHKLETLDTMMSKSTPPPQQIETTTTTTTSEGTHTETEADSAADLRTISSILLTLLQKLNDYDEHSGGETQNFGNYPVEMRQLVILLSKSIFGNEISQETLSSCGVKDDIYFNKEITNKDTERQQIIKRIVDLSQSQYTNNIEPKVFKSNSLVYINGNNNNNLGNRPTSSEKPKNRWVKPF